MEEKEKKTLKETLQKVMDTEKACKHLGTALACVWGGLAAVYAFLKDYLGTDFLPFFQKPFVVFCMVVALGVIAFLFWGHWFNSKKQVIKLNQRIEELEQVGEEPVVQNNPVHSKNDSIMKMLEYAHDHKMYNEVIKIGTSVSDFLWSTSRKELRIKVGEIVRAAAFELAKNSQDNADKEYAKRIEAKTLIEDIGNTKMCLDKSRVDEAIGNIKEGIEIAEDWSFHFESVRGHRNLANCYVLKTQFGEAEKEVEKAQKAIEGIVDAKERAMAAFDVTYALVKINKDRGKNDDAIKHLKTCIDLSKKEEKRDKSLKHAYADRLVKIYREMGIIYMKANDPQNARKAFTEGLKHAEQRQNHEDIVRCCTHLIDIQTQNRFAGLDKNVQNWINEAEDSLPMVDTSLHVEDFKKAKEAWEKACNGTK